MPPSYTSLDPPRASQIDVDTHDFFDDAGESVVTKHRAFEGQGFTA